MHGAEECWLLVAVFSELNGGSHKVAKGNICSCMRNITSLLIRSQDHIHGKCFYVHSLPQESIRLNFVFLNFVCLNSVCLNFVCLNFVCLNSVCLNFGGLGAHTVLGGPRELPVKTLALLHHMHRAQLRARFSEVLSSLKYSAFT